jgi:hypothetical protein
MRPTLAMQVSGTICTLYLIFDEDALGTLETSWEIPDILCITPLTSTMGGTVGLVQHRITAQAGRQVRVLHHHIMTLDTCRPLFTVTVLTHGIETHHIRVCRCIMSDSTGVVVVLFTVLASEVYSVQALEIHVRSTLPTLNNVRPAHITDTPTIHLSVDRKTLQVMQ